MAEKSFSVKEIQVQGSGTPTIESPSGGDLNITAATTTFSGAVQASGAFTINSASTIHVAESSDDNTFYNIPFLTTTGAAGGGRKFQIDNGGIQFNAFSNTFFVQNVQLGTGTGSNAAGSLSIFNSSGRKFGEINGIPFGEGNSSNATNIFIGDTTPSNSAGNHNFALGTQALDSSTGSITNNVAIGYQALKGNSGGAYNVAIGDNCLSGSGSYNIGLGRQAGQTINGAQYNVLLGYQPAYSMTDIGHSVAIGYQALYTISDGLLSGTSGTGNTYGHIAIGYNSQKFFQGIDANGEPNIAIGVMSLENNVQGRTNIAIGNNALRYLGKNCTSALQAQGGIGNIAIGHNAAKGGHTDTFSSTNTFRGNYNVAIGWESMTQIKSFSASSNTGVGAQAGGTITTGSNNTCLGNGANTSGLDGSASNEVVLGNSSVSVLRCQVNSISGLSDIRDKTDIVDLPIGLDFVNKLRPVKFKWAMREESVHNGTTRAGFIAQELSEIQKGNEYINLTHETNPDRLEAQQGNLIPVLVQAIKDLSAKNDALEARIKTLEES